MSKKIIACALLIVSIQNNSFSQTKKDTILFDNNNTVVSTGTDSTKDATSLVDLKNKKKQTWVDETKNSLQESGRDTILLLNGNVVISSIVDTANGVTTFIDPKNEKKNTYVDNDRIFSIKNNTGERFIYKYDTLIGNEFTTEEMRYFIKGEQDGYKSFNSPAAFWGNFIVGAGAGATGFFLCPIVPFVFTTLVGIPKIEIKKETVSDIEYLKQNPYVLGYQRVAKKKRKLKSLIGGGFGLGLGLGLWAIFK